MSDECFMYDVYIKQVFYLLNSTYNKKCMIDFV